MAKLPSTKRLAIKSANTQMVTIVAIASVVTTFCLFAIKAAYSENRYQSHVITAKQTALTQLQANLTAFSSLQSAYKQFNADQTNVIGGSKSGTGDTDGENVQIVLDALPKEYDFPALASSLEKLLTSQNVKVTSINGVDDQVNQQVAKAGSKPVPIPFTFSISNANYQSVNKLVNVLQNSIRPIQVDNMQINGSGDNVSLTVNAHTYYQPATDLTIKKQVIR